MPTVVILGGGVGGTCTANRLLRRRPDLDVVVVDSHGDHLYQPGFLHIPFHGEKRSLERPGGSLLLRGARYLVERAREIDRDRRRVLFDSGNSIAYDALVIATGSRLAHDGLPGAREANHQFHCRRGAHRLREALERFRGGDIVVGAAALPYKCPPSVLEFTFLLDEWLRARKIRDRASITYVYPLPDIFPFEEVARMARPMLEERGVKMATNFSSPSIDPGKRTVSSNGTALPFDLLVLVPPHTTAPFLHASDLAEAGGWIRTDPRTMRVAERIYAVGDTTNLPRPKSGSAAHFQADVVARNVLAEVDGREPEGRYDGRGACFLETGGRRASIIDFDYEHAPQPSRPGRWHYWKKRLFERFYFRMLRNV